MTNILDDQHTDALNSDADNNNFQVPNDLNNADDDNPKIIWDANVIKYKKDLVSQLGKLKNEAQEPIATIDGNTVVRLKDVGITTRNNASVSSITLEFEKNHTDPATVKVFVNLFSAPAKKVQDAALQPQSVRLTVRAVEKDDFLSSSSQLIAPTDEQLEPQLKNPIFTWKSDDVEGQQIYAKKWYQGVQPNLKFEGILGEISLALTDRFQVLWGGEITNVNLSEVHAKALIARAIDWVVFATYVDQPFDIHRNGTIATKEEGTQAQILGLIEPAGYNPKRPVDLSPFDLQKMAVLDGLFFPWGVYQTICTSMNLKRHLILTGPPGCGKSRLAVLIARMIGKKSGRSTESAEPKLVTASPSWTSGDVIGRYFPRQGKNELRFQPGVFLQALRSGRCLIIDEMNRANLDECFGELFTVLAGQAVDLVYTKSVPDEFDDNENNDSESEKETIVRIVPGSVTPHFATYSMGPTFRLIGTMNDADRSALHQISFALLRRFDVVRIDPPSIANLNQLLDKNLPIPKELEILNFRSRYLTTPEILVRSQVVDVISKLFYPSPPVEKYSGLIPEYIVGVATMLNVLEFVLEGLRPHSTGVVQVDGANSPEKQQKIKDFVTSLVTHALILTTVPQLDALTEDSFKKTLRHIKNCLGEANYLRLNLEEDRLTLVSITHDERNQKAFDIFLDEIARAARGTDRAVIVNEIRHEGETGIQL